MAISILFRDKTSLVKNEVWDGALSWCESQLFCLQSSRRSLRAFALNVTVVWEIDCLVYRDDFLANNPLNVKENYEHVRDFALHLSRPSRFRWVWNSASRHPCTAHAFFPERLPNRYQGLRHNCSDICTCTHICHRIVVEMTAPNDLLLSKWHTFHCLPLIYTCFLILLLCSSLLSDLELLIKHVNK